MTAHGSLERSSKGDSWCPVLEVCLCTVERTEKMKLKWWLQPGHHETTQMQVSDLGPSGRSGMGAASQVWNFWFGCLLGLLLLAIVVGGVVSAVAGHRHVPEPRHRVTLVTSTRPITGYIYDCFGSRLVQEVVEHRGETVTEKESATAVYNSGSQTQFMVFDARNPESCKALTNINVGALPGTLLVTLTWSQPELLFR